MKTDNPRIIDALKRGEEQLSGAGATDARRKARLLMRHVLNVDSAGLLAHETDFLQPEEIDTYQGLVDRALQEPVHRILGHREFHDLDLTLHPDTLEPREDTEAVIEAVLERLSSHRDASLCFADLGTGTGAIALALLIELPNANAILTDIADGAIETARANALKHELETRCQFAKGPWLEPLTGKFDFIVSNPPYIASSVVKSLDPIVRDHDPRLALDGGKDGLDAYRILLRDAASNLKPGGFLALEIGYDQADSVRKLAEETGWTLEKLAQDIGCNDRAMIFVP